MANLLSTTVNGSLLALNNGVSNAYTTASNGRLYLGSNAQNDYSIYTHMEGFNGNYTKLTLDWHTGIKIGASTLYGGIRFYSDAINNGGAKLFSIGEGDSNVRVTNTLYINGNTAIHSGGGQTIAGTTYFSSGESLNLYGIRGSFTNEYIHLYNKVGIGNPSGWGEGEGNTPTQGLSTYGGMSIAYGSGASSYIYGYLQIRKDWAGGDYGAEQLTIRGTYPSITLRSTQHDSKWLIHHASELQFYHGGEVDNNANWTAKLAIPTNGDIWMSWANDNISNLLGAKQDASTAITTSNIGSQSVNYATSSGTATSASQLSSVSFSGSEANALKTTLGVTGLPYSVDIYVEGDPNTYYPVHFIGGDQDVWRRIIIKRAYSEDAPWDPIGTGAHHGGLLLDWEGNFGGWGGATYSDRLRVFNESYTNVCADMYIYTHSMGYVFMLRGGHALYHIYSDQEIRGYNQVGTPDIAYDTTSMYFYYYGDGSGYNVRPPAPVTSINSSRIDGLRTKKQSQFDDRYQQSSTAINTGNIGSQSVNYASSAGSANSVSWDNVSSKPGFLSTSNDSEQEIGARYLTLNSGAARMNIDPRWNESGYDGDLGTLHIWSWTAGGTPYGRAGIALYNGSAYQYLTTRGGTTGLFVNNDEIIHAGNIGSQSVSYAASAGTADNIDGVGFRNTGSNAGTNADSINSNGITYYTGGVPNFSGNATDGALYSQAYSTEWQHQIAGDYRSGQIALRGKNAGTWQAWRTVIDSGNIGSQSVNYAASAGAVYGNQGDSFGLNDTKLYLRTNGDNNHYLWNADDDWEELNAYEGTGFRITGNGGGTGVLYVYGASNGGYTYSPYSFRAPIFYDSEDTGYYLDPNGTSNLNKFSDRTMGFNGMNPMSANSPYADRYNGSVSYRTGSMGYGTVDLGSIGSNWGSGFIDSWSSPAQQPNTSTSHWVGLQSIHYGHQDGSNFYGFQMVSGADTNRFYLRASWPNPLSWQEIITSGNIGSQSVASASNATTANGANGNFYIDDNYGNTVVGLYDSTRYQGVFAMGDSYKLPADGTTTGNLYGLAWSHPNAGGVAGNLNDHGLLVVNAGVFAAAISSSIRAASDMRAPIFYDSNDTGYYADFNATGNAAIRVRGGMLMGPNPTWGAYLQVGGDGNNGGSYANVVTTNGNLHLDSADGYSTYINHYYGGKIHFGSGGAGGGLYNHSNFSAAGNLHIGGSDADASYRLQVSGTGYATSDFRAPIFYDSNDTTYYLDPANSSLSLNVAGYTKSKFTYRNNSAAGLPGQDNPVKTATGVLATLSGSGGGNEYVIIKTRVPQDSYQMGGFTIDLFANYGSTNAKTTISLGGYWNAESNNGFEGWEYNTTNPNVRPSIQVMRDITDGSTCFAIQISKSYPVIVARDLYLGYNASDIEGWLDWSIFGADDLGGYTNNDTVVCRNAMPVDQWYGNSYIGGDGAYYGSSFILDSELVLNRYNSSNLRLRSASGSTAVGMLGVDGGNNYRFQLYGDGAGYGFLGYAWGDWDLRKVPDEALYMNNNNDFYLKTNGTSRLNVVNDNGGDTYGVKYFYSNKGATAALADYTNPALQVFSNDAGPAFMSFHRGGYYAVNFGLDNDNVLRVGGWSASSNRMQLDMSGNVTFAGDVTAYSDARVKENVHTIENALDKTLQLRGVTYNRTDSEDKSTKVGVIAQEVLEVVPEVVNQDASGMYNVSYGNLTAVLIEAIKEQQKQIDELKEIINGLTK